MKTYNDLYLDNKNTLRDSGSQNYQFEARLILAASANKDISQILANKNLYVNSDVEKRNAEFLTRLLNGEPIAYVLNSWEFYGLTFYVDNNVLIPRIDTETIIDSVKELYPDPKSKLRILDLCTGSGCIACTLAHEYPNSNVTAVDISKAAIETCKRNVQSLRLGSQVTCINADVKLSADIKLGEFDLIVSNPPYIESNVISSLESSVKDYEPLLALDGGNDGLDFYRAIIENYTLLLKNDSYIIFEVGEDQSKLVSKLLIDAGYRASDTRKDTIDIERVVIGRK